MEASAGLVAGSYRRNELVRIRHESDGGSKAMKNMDPHTCQICGDNAGLTETGDLFVACNECAFPVCRPCYEYERKDGTQCCPQCKTRYRRLRGSPRVEGDEDEDDVDDIENEFNYAQGANKGRRQQRHGEEFSSSSRHESQPIPLLTHGHTVSGEIRTPDTQSVRTTSGPLGPDHPGMIQVFLGHSGGLDTDGNELPRLIYVSREKRPGFQHHKKAGAMNALIRVSAVLTNGAYLLNVDCDHYFNNSKAIKEAMCFLMDPAYGKKCCYVQFPQRFDGIDLHDRYANRNIVFFDINLKGLDGIQGPVYVGTGCCFNRQALYGYDPVLTEEDLEPNIIVKSCCGSRKKGKKSKKYNYDQQRRGINRSDSNAPLFNMDDIEEGFEGYDDERSILMSQKSVEKRFGQSPVFIAATFMEQGGIPPTTNPATLLKEAIHVISCGYEDKTEWGKEIGWIYGSVTEDILTGLRLLERLAYINTIVYPITALPLIAYCILPAFCLITDKFIIPEISNYASIWFILLFISIAVTGVLELRWSGVSIEDWWRNEQFWVIGGTSAHLFAVFQGLLKVLAGIDTNFTVTSKASDEDGDFAELYIFKWTALLIPPTTVLVVNLIGIVAGVSYAVNSGYQSWGPLFGKLFFALWVIAHLYPFLKGLMGRQNRTPTIVIVWSVLLASIFSLLWVRINPFVSVTPEANPTAVPGGVF
ncbi:hypothetical protein BRARA_K00698 [Brassica rapa]|uniref:Cellulose synthase n=1 Tax=Brassica campestris TaxID=3711 RepID=A0A397KZS2_BRACM|nr:hypothetical protein BRARA_K00698 [Brassica rapa]